MVIPQQARGSRRFFWDFVINNYTNEECELVKEHIPKICSAYVVSKEVGEKGTPHLQGAIKLKKSNHMSYIINTFKGTSLFTRISLREGRNIDRLRNYCMGLKADGTPKDTPSEIWIQNNVELIHLPKKVKWCIEDDIKKKWEYINRKEIYDKFLKEVDPTFSEYNWLKKHLEDNLNKCNYRRHIKTGLIRELGNE